MKNKDYKKLLNLSFTDITSQAYFCGKYDLPYAYCKDVNIDYIALYPNLNEYSKTKNTAVGFYVFDLKFDNIRGLFSAIYYNDIKRLDYFKERFKGVKYAIAPDYSQIGDIPRVENLYRLFKTRIVSLWLTIECDVIVIPNITYANENYFDVMLDGMEDCECVAFGVKGSIKELSQRELLLKAIKYAVDNLKKLKTIIVYSVCIDNSIIFEIFQYAISKGIKVIIPDNLLRSRNRLKEAFKNG
ncbi:MAG: DUF4417 domain-containing protein [Bacilli bacterium]|nr:DUF4417 domain-containing protein [Bacilli bacterium]